MLENLALRHQLLVLNRTAKTPALRNADRLFWAALSTMWSRWTKALVIVPPQTVVRWHQAGFRLYWRWKSRRRTGRAPKDRELIELIPFHLQLRRAVWNRPSESDPSVGYSIGPRCLRAASARHPSEVESPIAVHQLPHGIPP